MDGVQKMNVLNEGPMPIPMQYKIVHTGVQIFKQAF